MIVPADEAPMTNGSPYVVRHPPARGAAMVAKVPLLRCPLRVPTQDSRARSVHHLPAARTRPEWRYLGLSSERSQGAAEQARLAWRNARGSVLLAGGEANGLDDGRVGERRRVAEGLAVGDVAQEPAHDLAGA